MRAAIHAKLQRLAKNYSKTGLGLWTIRASIGERSGMLLAGISALGVSHPLILGVNPEEMKITMEAR